MKILFMTSSMANDDFIAYANRAKIKPNPSNQNFYNKLIRALGAFNDLTVLSLRPFVKSMFEDDMLHYRKSNENNITYHYAECKSGIFYKFFKEPSVLKACAEKIIKEQQYNSNFIIIVDSLRRGLVKCAKAIANKYNVPAIAVVTDNPMNLSNTRKSRAHKMVKQAQGFDGYIALTKTLNDIYNSKRKPYYILEGLVEDFPESKKKPIGNYFFFGGALYRRYGVKTLIDAFHNLKTDAKLVIAGTGELKQYIYNMVEKDRRILYLSLISKDAIYNLEQHSIANVNPRPYNFDLNKESIPSKLLDYLASGSPTISTIHETFLPLFSNDVTWIENESEKCLHDTLQTFLESDQEQLKRNALSARQKIYEMYGLRQQGEMISHFLASFKQSSID